MSARRTRFASTPGAAVVGYIVMQGGLACMLYNAACERVGGVLLPGFPIVRFLKKRDAERAIQRTQRVATLLKGSLVDDWLKLSPIFSDQPYVIQPLVSSYRRAALVQKPSVQPQEL